jgi:hypothetical protein
MDAGVFISQFPTGPGSATAVAGMVNKAKKVSILLNIKLSPFLEKNSTSDSVLIAVTYP